MSHSKERHEKICLNCNAELSGRYCHECGQENIEPKETVWGLISHFFYDITHFDGKFFSTTRYLITKPGFLPQEYLKGRRARYLHPIRMYVFSSAMFFIIFFMMFKPKEWFNGNFDLDDDVITNVRDSAIQLDIAQRLVLKTAHSREDSLDIIQSFSQAKEKVIATNEKIKVKDSLRADSLRHKLGGAQNKPVKRIPWGKAHQYYKSVAEYDSIQQQLPPGIKDGWWERKAARRNIELNKRYGDHEDKLLEDLADKFMHSLPYLLFISLPLYAFFMKLLYIRHKQIYYVEHGIFFIYLYIFTFIFLLLYFSVMELRQYTHQGWIGWFEALLILCGVFYTYKAMRKFYGQGRGMTILKFFLLNMLAFFTLLILFIFFFTITIFRV